jgi:hypothetical protein
MKDSSGCFQGKSQIEICLARYSWKRLRGRLMDNNSNGHTANKPPDLSRPTCPKCGVELDGRFGEATVQFQSGLTAHLYWCPNTACRALFSMQIVAQAKREEPRIAMPGDPIPFIKH